MPLDVARFSSWDGSDTCADADGQYGDADADVDADGHACMDGHAQQHQHHHQQERQEQCRLQGADRSSGAVKLPSGAAKEVRYAASFAG